MPKSRHQILSVAALLGIYLAYFSVGVITCTAVYLHSVHWRLLHMTQHMTKYCSWYAHTKKALGNPSLSRHGRLQQDTHLQSFFLIKTKNQTSRLKWFCSLYLKELNTHTMFPLAMAIGYFTLKIKTPSCMWVQKVKFLCF